MSTDPRRWPARVAAAGRAGVDRGAAGGRVLLARMDPIRRTISKRGRLMALLALAAVVVPVLLLGVYPTRPFLAQRTATNEARAELAELERENGELEERVERLQTPEEIERMAREDHGLVRPGERAYAVLPAPPEPVDLPEVWPFEGVDDTLNR